MKPLNPYLLFISFIVFIFCSHKVLAQKVSNIDELKPTEDFDNVHVQKLYSDLNSTAFVIWVKNSVKPHYHAQHSESLYVLSGTGTMKIGDEITEIGPGDCFTIPEKMIHSVEVKGDVPLKVLSIQAPEFLGKDRIYVN